MDGSYERALTGADVIARARAAGVEPAQARIIAAAIDPAIEISGPEELARVIGPARLGMSSGRWGHVFGPLFGEFE
jgi:hypothetical protein